MIELLSKLFHVSLLFDSLHGILIGLIIRFGAFQQLLQSCMDGLYGPLPGQ